MPGKGKPFTEGMGGRPKGVQNKLTRTVKDVVLATFNTLQEDKAHNLEAFAKKNPRDFYQIAAKLIPTEIKGNVKQTNKVLLEIVRNTKGSTGA